MRKDGADRLAPSPWQPRRLRRRGRRHGQPVPFLGHRLHRTQRPGRGQEGHPCLAGRGVDRPAADRPGRRGQRVRVGDRGGRPPGQRPREGRRRDHVRHRHGPRRVPARGRVRAAHRDRRVADPRRTADLARGHRAGCRRWPGRPKTLPDAPRRRARPRAGTGRVHRRRAARARAGARRGGLTGQAACSAAGAAAPPDHHSGGQAGHKRTCAVQYVMSALPPESGHSRAPLVEMSAKCQ